jgi:hypothetical protein
MRRLQILNLITLLSSGAGCYAKTFMVKHICMQPSGTAELEKTQDVLILKSTICDLPAAKHRIVYRSLTHGLSLIRISSA